MGKYCHYDAVERVIFTDLSTSIASPEVVDEIINEIIATARLLPHKVFMVVSWRDVPLEMTSAARYSQRLPEVMHHLLGVVRYDVTDTMARIAIRAETVKQNLQKAQSHIYPSKEEALAAVRRMEQTLTVDGGIKNVR